MLTKLTVFTVGEALDSKQRRLNMIKAVEGDDWSAVIDSQTQQTIEGISRLQAWVYSFWSSTSSARMQLITFFRYQLLWLLVNVSACRSLLPNISANTCAVSRKAAPLLGCKELLDEVLIHMWATLQQVLITTEWVPSCPHETIYRRYFVKNCAVFRTYHLLCVIFLLLSLVNDKLYSGL